VGSVAWCVMGDGAVWMGVMVWCVDGCDGVYEGVGMMVWV
jgi:hypothetical protein